MASHLQKCIKVYIFGSSVQDLCTYRKIAKTTKWDNCNNPLAVVSEQCCLFCWVSHINPQEWISGNCNFFVRIPQTSHAVVGCGMSVGPLNERWSFSFFFLFLSQTEHPYLSTQPPHISYLRDPHKAQIICLVSFYIVLVHVERCFSVLIVVLTKFLPTEEASGITWTHICIELCYLTIIY